MSLIEQAREEPALLHLCDANQIAAALLAAEEMVTKAEGMIESDGIVYLQVPMHLVDAYREAVA